MAPPCQSLSTEAAVWHPMRGFKNDKRMPFGGFEIVGGDIRRKCGVTEFIDKDAAEDGHGALSLPSLREHGFAVAVLARFRSLAV